MSAIDTFIEANSSKIVFLVLMYVIISSGYISHFFPCQTQELFMNNYWIKHVLGVLIIFSFIMFEGGWSFNKEEQDKAPVDWESGNTIDSLKYGIIIYSVFLLSSKMTVESNLLMYLLLFLCYMINTQRIYWEKRDMITDEQKKKYLQMIKVLLSICLIIYIYGISSYYNLKKKEYKKDFTLHQFFLGNNDCKKFISGKYKNTKRVTSL